MNARTLAPLALLLAGCGVDNFASIQLFEICFPPAPDTTTGVCIYPAKCDNSLLGRPLVVVPGATQLEVPIQVNNQLKSDADPSTGRVNTNDAHIEKYTISYGVPGVGVAGAVSLANDTVPADGNTVVLVEVLSSAAITALGASALPAGTTTIVAKVVASGRYDNGTTFETGAYKVAVDVCKGCATAPVVCSGTTVLFGACPGSAVIGGQVVSSPVNIACK
jgi:hypothetical protein